MFVKQKDVLEKLYKNWPRGGSNHDHRFGSQVH